MEKLHTNSGHINDVMGGTCSTHRRYKKIQILVGPEGKRPLDVDRRIF